MRWVLVILLMFSSLAQASYFINLDAFYFADTNKTDATLTNGRTFIDFAVGIPITNKKEWFVSWNVTSISAKDTGGTEDLTWSTLDMGPKVTYLSKKGWTSSLAYNLSAKGKYQAAETATWTGTSILFDAGYLQEISDSTQLGIKINYYANTVKESVVGSTTYSQVSYTRNWIFPTISLIVHD